jgi:hypothetical protein
MPGPTAAPRDGRLTPDRARELADRRWQRDNQGLDDCIDRLDKRRDALTGEQGNRLAEIGDWIERKLAAAPPLSEQQLSRIRAALPLAGSSDAPAT